MAYQVTSFSLCALQDHGMLLQDCTSIPQDLLDLSIFLLSDEFLEYC